MSGGQYNGDQAKTIASRLGWDRRPAARKQPQELPAHCWVVDVPELPPGRRPGLLVAWQRTDAGWQGRVVLSVDGTLGPLVMTLVVAAEHLRPTG